MEVLSPSPVWLQWLGEMQGKHIVMHYYDGRTVSGTIVQYDGLAVSILSPSREGKEYPIIASLSEVRYMIAVTPSVAA